MNTRMMFARAGALTIEVCRTKKGEVRCGYRWRIVNYCSF